MEEMHQNKCFSVNAEGQLCIDDHVVDSDMILFEEEAKLLLEQELMEGPLYYYPETEDDYSALETDSEDLMNDDDIYYEGNNFDLFSDDTE